ncbi:MAG: FKBP-type peptidyl-prolyl cis-trans isomerase [Bacteroidota bacterium]|nr:FKBP-type peptidyl-prolyl cis-trans isomerase [Bacteroidota bacterium]
MKQLLIASMCLALLACNSQTGKKANLKTDRDSISYSIGLDIGTTLQRQDIAIEPDAFVQGIKDAADSSSKKLMTEEQIRTTMMAFQQKMMEKAQAKMQERSAKAKKEGEAFLAANKTKPGVVTTASGLQYRVVSAANGKKPKASDKVKVHYRGTLVDGTEFDNSYKRGEAIVLPVSGVIPGWTEALQLMPVGSKWQVFVPAALGYGDRPAGSIPPGSVLIFEVELLGIEK